MVQSEGDFHTKGAGIFLSVYTAKGKVLNRSDFEIWQHPPCVLSVGSLHR